MSGGIMMKSSMIIFSFTCYVSVPSLFHYILRDSCALTGLVFAIPWVRTVRSYLLAKCLYKAYKADSTKTFDGQYASMYHCNYNVTKPFLSHGPFDSLLLSDSLVAFRNLRAHPGCLKCVNE